MITSKRQTVEDFDPEDYENTPESVPDIIPGPAEIVKIKSDIELLRQNISEMTDAVNMILQTLKQPPQTTPLNNEQPHRGAELSSLREMAQIMVMLQKSNSEAAEGALKLGVQIGATRAIAEAEGDRADELSEKLEEAQRSILQISKSPKSTDVKALTDTVKPVLADLIAALRTRPQ